MTAPACRLAGWEDRVTGPSPNLKYLIFGNSSHIADTSLFGRTMRWRAILYRLWPMLKLYTTPLIRTVYIKPVKTKVKSKALWALRLSIAHHRYSGAGPRRARRSQAPHLSTRCRRCMDRGPISTVPAIPPRCCAGWYAPLSLATDRRRACPPS